VGGRSGRLAAGYAGAVQVDGRLLIVVQLVHQEPPEREVRQAGGLRITGRRADSVQ
jgi:hypothetical protein